MKKINLYAGMLACLVMAACMSTKKAIKDIPQATPITKDDEWTLERSPNGLDVVGVVFAIDATGEPPKRVPGGYFTLKTRVAPVAVTSQSFKKNVSAGAMLNFLNIKNIGPESNLSAHDTSRVEAVFKIENGTITTCDEDDLENVFNAKRESIARTLKGLNWKDVNLYMIFETIESPNVSITFEKSRANSVNLFGKFKEIISANPQISTSGEANTSLVYKQEKPVTVFYKLYSVDMFIVRGKGNEPDRIDVTLGKIVRSDELVYKKNK